MSADNGFVIKPHPDGGFAAVMYSASSEDQSPPVRWGANNPHLSYPSVEAAVADAEKQGSEYGVHVDVSCDWSQGQSAPAPKSIHVVTSQFESGAFTVDAAFFTEEEALDYAKQERRCMVEGYKCTYVDSLVMS